MVVAAKLCITKAQTPYPIKAKEIPIIPDNNVLDIEILAGVLKSRLMFITAP